MMNLFVGFAAIGLFLVGAYGIKISITRWGPDERVSPAEKFAMTYNKKERD